MERRSFLKKAGVGLAAGAVAAPAIAQQQQPSIQWRMTSSFPKSLDIIFGAADDIARRVSELTDGKFQIRTFAGGEIVPPLQALDAVQAGTVECCHTAPYYYVGKDPAFAFGTAVPFGLDARQQNAWRYEGGGMDAMQQLYKDSGVIGYPAGNTGTQMGGWYRKEIKSVADMRGLKMRIAGIAGQVWAKLGAVPTQIAGGDIYPSLEKGTIDAAEWVGPYDDEKLGFYKVAKFYYTPGWWEGCAEISFFVNEKKFAELPKHYQAALQVACAEANQLMQARYDVKNPDALRRLIAGGAQLRSFPRPVMEAALKAAIELYEELSAKSPHWKRIYQSWRKFRSDEFQWFRVAETTYADFTFPAVLASERPQAAVKGAAKK